MAPLDYTRVPFINKISNYDELSYYDLNILGEYIIDYNIDIISFYYYNFQIAFRIFSILELVIYFFTDLPIITKNFD